MWKPENSRPPLSFRKPSDREEIIGDMRFRSNTSALIAVMCDSLELSMYIWKTPKGNYFLQEDHRDGSGEFRYGNIKFLNRGDAARYYESPSTLRLVDHNDAFPGGLQDW